MTKPTERVRWDHVQEQILKDIVNGKVIGSEKLPAIIIHSRTNSRYTKEW